MWRRAEKSALIKSEFREGARLPQHTKPGFHGKV